MARRRVEIRSRREARARLGSRAPSPREQLPPLEPAPEPPQGLVGSCNSQSQVGGLWLRGTVGSGSAGSGMVGLCVRMGPFLAPADFPGHVALEASKWASAALPGGCVHGPFIHSFPSCVSGSPTCWVPSIVPDTPFHLYPRTQWVAHLSNIPWGRCAHGGEPWIPGGRADGGLCLPGLWAGGGVR